MTFFLPLFLSIEAIKYTENMNEWGGFALYKLNNDTWQAYSLNISYTGSHTPTSTIKKTQSNEPIAMMEWYLNTHAHTNSVYKSMRIFSHLVVDIEENKTKMGKFDMELVVCLA